MNVTDETDIRNCDLDGSDDEHALQVYVLELLDFKLSNTQHTRMTYKVQKTVGESLHRGPTRYVPLYGRFATYPFTKEKWFLHSRLAYFKKSQTSATYERKQVISSRKTIDD